MRWTHLVASAILVLTGVAGAAQSVPPAKSDRDDVVVTGRRTQPSDWREAETAHVVVLSNGREAELVRIARDLERLHFLLSALLGRVDRPDPTVKLRVTLIGDTAEFSAMDLRNLRWQQGPFPPEFAVSRYYDPRDDGAVMATTRIDQKVVVERGISWERFQGLAGALAGQRGDVAGSSETGGFGGGALIGLSSTGEWRRPPNEKSVPLPADYLLRAGFAQHFLLTYFPAAYPRWYLDGFGQLFATVEAHGDTRLDYGRVPVGTTATLDRYGGFPLARLFDGSYLDGKARQRWTPTHAWMLTHFLFFSDKWRPSLRRYLLAYANGTPSAEAAASAFGDLDVLARELRAYYRGKKPFDQMTYPAERAGEPAVRRLTKGQAAFVKGQLELGSRIELPPVAVPGASSKETAKLEEARREALAGRARWLDRLRQEAARYPADREAQLLLAEAECRTDQAAECEAAADRVLAGAPGDVDALAWKGMALAARAAAAPAAERAEQLRAARAWITRANRTNNDAVLPLLAYYRSFAGETAPPLAVDALAGAVARVPNAPASRVALGAELAGRGRADEAAAVLRPVALGGHLSPERAQAEATLRAIAR